ncbi:MAG: hypothetical protein ACR2LX_11015 [Jatrophihabitans sp.]
MLELGRATYPGCAMQYLRQLGRFDSAHHEVVARSAGARVRGSN